MVVVREERAFWVREPGLGEIRPVLLPAPRDGRGARAHAVLRRQPRHRDPGLPRRRPRGPARPDARSAPGRRVPGPGEVRLPERRPGRGTAHRRSAAAPCSASTRTRRRTSCRRPTWSSCPTTSRPLARCSRAPSRRPSTPSGTRHLWWATGSPSWGQGWSAAASPACWPASRGWRSTLVDTDPARAHTAAALGVGFAIAGRRPRRPRPGRARERDLRRPAALARAVGAGRRRRRPELVRRHPGPARPRRGVPRRAPVVRASQVGEVALARRHRRSRSERLALALELLRDEAFDALLTGTSPFADLPTLMAELSSGSRSALCHAITYPEVPCSA